MISERKKWVPAQISELNDRFWVVENKNCGKRFELVARFCAIETSSSEQTARLVSGLWVTEPSHGAKTTELVDRFWDEKQAQELLISLPELEGKTHWTFA